MTKVDLNIDDINKESKKITARYNLSYKLKIKTLVHLTQMAYSLQYGKEIIKTSSLGMLINPKQYFSQ